MERLDVINAPLAGLNLIEANAGTGKTWTITALYLRLLLEAQRAVESILVVTFTEAATAELRDRVRKRLTDARIAFERGQAEEGDVLVAQLLGRVTDQKQALLQLTSALRNFDQAPIYTIHGFCQRVLGDRAFESGMPFATEILPDQSELLQEIADDFWRNELYDASALFIGYALKNKLQPATLGNELKGRVGKPYLEIRGPAAAEATAALERAYQDAYGRARTVWLEAREAIQAQLLDNAALNGSRYRKERVTVWLQQMERCLCSEAAGIDLFERFDKFTPRVLAEGTKKNMTPPSHPFYEACRQVKETHETLNAAYQRCVGVLKVKLLEYCNGELATRKQRRRLQSYDDLLLNLEQALGEARGDALGRALRSRYTAALIDEFQDTDPVQYEIFRRVYEATELPVFLVGDPKQSIYSFRGADVFIYLKARRDARQGHTLDVNWRSEPGLLAAVNALFDQAPTPFVIGGIPFHPSEPAPGSRGRFVIEGEKSVPFEFWCVGSEDGKPLAKEAATELAARASAAEIARLLNLGVRNQARIGEPVDGGITERTLKGGDVAVLVRTHRQARIARDALRALGVASVERGVENVFATREAEELERVLMAIAEPGREPLVRAALTTDMMGFSGAALHEICADEARWEQMIESFREFHREWREHGFIGMARAYFQRFEVMTRLLEYADGERRATNVLHLAELLHREAGRHGIGGLMEWFSGKRKSPAPGNDEELLRLESDENLVKILTVHVAKGLEYPLVFCPFLWDGTLRSREASAIMFHDPAQEDKPVLDVGSEGLAAGRALAQREELAESLRLIYVALTRAKYRCWMVWGNIRDAGTSAPAWLLHRASDQDGASPSKKEDPAIIAIPLSDAKIRADLDRLAKGAGGTIRVAPIPLGSGIRFEPPEATAPALSPRPFVAALRDAWRVTSFTGLTHAHAAETPDYDAADRWAEAEAAAGAQDIFAFPRGARTGKCLHAIFEQADFTNLSRARLETLVARELSSHGFGAHWVPVVADTVQRVVATPLDETGTLRLDRVPAAARFNELEFYYPIAGLSDVGLRALLLDWGFPEEIRERIGSLTFAPAHGFMKGFIDLIFEAGGRFYLADYKSNWLGATLDAYGQAGLARAMAREAYYLQYLIYCVALHRYLASRVPGYDYESRFGGVRYLFVRGMRPESGLACGVYADRPSAGLISALDDFLRTGKLDKQ